VPVVVARTRDVGEILQGAPHRTLVEGEIYVPERPGQAVDRFGIGAQKPVHPWWRQRLDQVEDVAEAAQHPRPALSSDSEPPMPIEKPATDTAEHRLISYQALVPHLVQQILLVASPYDSFILEEEGRFSDRLLSQYQELDLSGPPSFKHVASARDALDQLCSESYDLVITTPHVRDMTPQELGREIVDRYPGTPVVLLTYDRTDAQSWTGAERDLSGIDAVFLWTGDPRLLLAIVKSVEDKKNVDHDTRHGQVRVIVVVEDSPAYYSSFLPIIYAELLEQVRTLLADRLNERDRNYRMRARPKILLARTYEEGRDLFARYRDNVLGVISDVRFPRQGKLDPTAGLKLVEMVREEYPDLPVLLQSRERELQAQAEALGVGFVDKNSPDLLRELSKFMRRNFGFGPFIFRHGPDGEELRRAVNVQEMYEALAEIDAGSLEYHASRNHVSNWLMARGEFPLAKALRPKQVSDFTDVEEMRRFVVDLFSEFLERRQRGQVTDFRASADPLRRDFLRLGRGSMGGKGRSIAFLSHLKAQSGRRKQWEERWPDLRVIVPRTVVICTEIFDRFVARNELRERAMEAASDEEVARLFLDQPLGYELLADLAAILREVRYPLAVRSSSLLEDSEFQPLAGLYRTYLLPNCAAEDGVRLDQLSRAVRLVFASTFYQDARTAMEAASLRVEEEKMAVVVQRLVGRRFGRRFYPHFSGVAQSHNFYPMGHLKPEDGIATVALGLGHTVVTSGQGYRFSPRHPRVAPHMSTTDAALRNSQRTFYALDLGEPDVEVGLDEAGNLLPLGLEEAEADGTLALVGATYVADDDRIYDSLRHEGARLVNFAGVLKHDGFPLAPALEELLEMCEEGMGTPCELEFAVAVLGDGEPSQLAALQLRPLVAQGRDRLIDLTAVADRPQLLAGPALGNGVVDAIRDVVYVHPDRFDVGHTQELAEAVGRLNGRLARAHRPYLLVGPGRWGTADRFLGVPVSWGQVSAARVIVELALADGHIEPSQGTHFFHNITSLRIGYFSLDARQQGQEIDLDYLEGLEAVDEEGALRHVELPAEAEAWIDGRSGEGVVVRGESAEG